MYRLRLWVLAGRSRVFANCVVLMDGRQRVGPLWGLCPFQSDMHATAVEGNKNITILLLAALLESIDSSEFVLGCISVFDTGKIRSVLDCAIPFLVYNLQLKAAVCIVYLYITISV